jgi:hypothetical protein
MAVEDRLSKPVTFVKAGGVMDEFRVSPMIDKTDHDEESQEQWFDAEEDDEFEDVEEDDEDADLYKLALDDPMCRRGAQRCLRHLCYVERPEVYSGAGS